MVLFIMTIVMFLLSTAQVVANFGAILAQVAELHFGTKVQSFEDRRLLSIDAQLKFHYSYTILFQLQVS